MALAMLVDRRFEPLVARIEAWAGGDLEVQRDALVARLRSATSLEPTLGRARDTATVLARTAMHRRRWRCSIVRSRPSVRRATITIMRAAWCGSPRCARAPASATRHASWRRMKAALANGVTGPMLVNVVPNLAIDQIALGQPAAALATLDRYPTTPDKVRDGRSLRLFRRDPRLRAGELGRKPAMRRRRSARSNALRQQLRARPTLAIACAGSDAEVAAQWMGVRTSRRRAAAH